MTFPGHKALMGQQETNFAQIQISQCRFMCHHVAFGNHIFRFLRISAVVVVIVILVVVVGGDGGAVVCSLFMYRFHLYCQQQALAKTQH